MRYPRPISGARLRPTAMESAACIACLAALLPAPPAFSQAPTRLRYRLRTGDRFTYRLSLSGRFAGQASAGTPIPPFQFSGTVKQQRTVALVYPDGRYAFEDRTLGGQFEMSVQGMTRRMPVPPTAPQYSTINAVGRMVLAPAQKAALLAAGARFGIDPNEILTPFTTLGAFPAEAVGPGSHWQRKASLKLPAGIAFAIIVENRLTKWARVSGVSTAEVVSSLRAPLRVAYRQGDGALQVNGDATGRFRANYSLATGMPVRAGGTFGGSVLIAADGGRFGASGGPQSARLGVNVAVQVQMIGARRGVDTSSMASSVAALPGPRGADGVTGGRIRPGKGASAAGPETLPPASSRRPGKVPAAAAARSSQSAMASVPGPAAAMNGSAPDTGPPPAELVGPADGAAVQGSVDLQAILHSPGKEVAYMAFLVNGERSFITNNPPYRFTWDASGIPAGPYTLSIEVHSVNGAVLYRSSPRRIRVISVSPR